MNGLMKVVGGLYRIQEFDISWVLETFTQNDGPVKMEIGGYEYLVKKGSQRYHLFKKKGLTCT